MVMKLFQKLRYMLNMCLPNSTINQYDIKKGHISNICLQDFIHGALKDGGSITNSKMRDQKLILVFMCLEICLRNILLFHLDLMETRIEMKFGEELGTMELIELINEF